MAGFIAVAQNDIKKVLAYSTVSQLGYMFLGLGVGAWHAALFHLTTHAFFKALMFLGSGSVIHACHHEQDMRKMGGLWKKLPVTGTTFLVGVLAISGAARSSRASTRRTPSSPARTTASRSCSGSGSRRPCSRPST